MEIIKLQQLQENFNSAIEKSIDQKFDINNEINEVLSYARTIPEYTPTFRKPTHTQLKNKSNRIFELNIGNLNRTLFRDSFNSFIRYGKYELEKFHTDTNESHLMKELIVKQAFEFSEYYKWLNSLLNTPQKATTKNSLSHKQKLLALHYLGLNTVKYENTKIAKVLAEVLELSEDNTRIFLSYLSAGKNEVRTKANLEKVNQLFEKQGISEISDVIKKDIENL